MSEKIISISEHDRKLNNERQSGYKITTTEQEIFLMMDSQQSCCENWGYFMSEDDLQDFIGSDLLGITLTDTALKTKELDEVDFSYGGNIMFVNLLTSNGVLQFVAYNEHNGFYGHQAIVESNQLKHEEYL